MVARPVESISTELVEAAGDLGDDRLAFLVLTSKPEMQIRDALAWALHRNLGVDYILSREWHRTDLALLDSDGMPVVLLEAKAMYTFDALAPVTLAKFMTYLEADHAKAERLAKEGTRIVLLLVVTHVADPVPGQLMSVVKYSKAINASLRKRSSIDLNDTAHEILRSTLNQEGQDVREVPLTSGSAFEIRCSTTAYVIG